jgi:hypothetical protein
MAWARWLVVNTPYHEQHCAMRISGTIAHATVKAVSTPAIPPRWCRTMAHWAAKQTSATVATDRPTRTLDSQVSNRQIRCTSARGRNDLKAQPKT